jgi:inosine/xanthosine triphosphatase
MSSITLFVVGSENRGKIQAVENAIKKYPEIFGSIKVSGFKAASLVSDQPLSLEETLTGARNRAKAAYEFALTNPDSVSTATCYGVGLESGIFAVPFTKTGYMDTTACVFYDGKEFHQGLSSCFEYPKKMIEKVLHESKEISDIAVELGFSKASEELRQELGMIGLLTGGVLNRTAYSEQAVVNALIHLKNPELY